jgi:hypothetical protein
MTGGLARSSSKIEYGLVIYEHQKEVVIIRK